MADDLALNIFHGIIKGDQTGGMLCPMEPAFLGTTKQAYVIFELLPRQGIKGYYVQFIRFLHRGATISAIKDSRYFDHTYCLLLDSFSS